MLGQYFNRLQTIFFFQKQNADLAFVCQNGELVHANRAFLCGQSKVLSKLLNKDHVQCQGHVSYVSMADVKARHVEGMLELLITGKTGLEGHIMDVLDMLDIQMRRASLEVFEDDVAMDNVDTEAIQDNQVSNGTETPVGSNRPISQSFVDRGAGRSLLETSYKSISKEKMDKSLENPIRSEKRKLSVGSAVDMSNTASAEKRSGSLISFRVCSEKQNVKATKETPNADSLANSKPYRSAIMASAQTPCLTEHDKTSSISDESSTCAISRRHLACAQSLPHYDPCEDIGSFFNVASEVLDSIPKGQHPPGSRYRILELLKAVKYNKPTLNCPYCPFVSSKTPGVLIMQHVTRHFYETLANAIPKGYLKNPYCYQCGATGLMKRKDTFLAHMVRKHKALDGVWPKVFQTFADDLSDRKSFLNQAAFDPSEEKENIKCHGVDEAAGSQKRIAAFAKRTKLKQRAKCPYCPKVVDTANEANCKRHLSTHFLADLKKLFPSIHVHSKKVPSCPICGLGKFAYHQNLHSHMVVAHDVLKSVWPTEFSSLLCEKDVGSGRRGVESNYQLTTDIMTVCNAKDKTEKQYHQPQDKPTSNPLLSDSTDEDDTFGGFGEYIPAADQSVTVHHGKKQKKKKIGTPRIFQVGVAQANADPMNPGSKQRILKFTQQINSRTPSTCPYCPKKFPHMRQSPLRIHLLFHFREMFLTKYPQLRLSQGNKLKCPVCRRNEPGSVTLMLKHMDSAHKSLTEILPLEIKLALENIPK